MNKNNLLETILNSTRSYIVLETKYTIHHVVRLVPSYKNNGKWKWSTETKPIMFNKIKEDDEAIRSYIDHNSGFPRYFFNIECLLKELESWLSERELELQNECMI